MKQRTCRHCTEIFEDQHDAPRGHWSRFCSDTCRAAASVAAANRKILRRYHGHAVHDCRR